MSEYVISKIFVDIDALLDTRLSTFVLEFPNIDAAVLEAYSLRISDTLPGISYTEFREAYAKRNRATLRNALPTCIMPEILTIKAESVKSGITSPVNTVIEVYVNFYPYKLDEDEIKLICNSISAYLGCTVYSVNKSNSEITPKEIGDEFDLLIKYDYIDWLDEHSKNEEFNRVRCPRTVMWAPALYFSEKVSVFNLDDFLKMEEFAGPIINLKYFPGYKFGAFRLE